MAVKKVAVGDKPMTKTQILSAVSDLCGMTKKDIGEVLDALNHVMMAHIGKKGPGVFVWPGMLKISVVKKPAVKARQGVNPFTGEQMMFKAKPASRAVKVRPLKTLKDAAN